MTNWYFEAISLDVRCPSCARTLHEPIGRLKDSPTLVCPSCKQRIKVQGAQLKIVLVAAEEQIAQMVRLIQSSLRVEVVPNLPAPPSPRRQ